MKEKIEIPLSKLKIGLLFMGTLGFVVIGILFIKNPEGWTTTRFEPVFISIVGIVATVFFGGCAVYIGRKLFDQQIGLTIDDQGITDNTNATSVGLIAWADITGIQRLQIASSKILLIHTDKPDKYIERAKNGLSKRAMKANHKMYGSPISIISSSLAIKFDELEGLIRSELEKRDM